MPGLQPHGGLLTTRAKGPVQGCRNTFYFGGDNFSYQNMDVARTRFTSVARKLLGGGYSPPHLHGSYTYAVPFKNSLEKHDHSFCFLVLHVCTYTDTRSNQ